VFAESLLGQKHDQKAIPFLEVDALARMNAMASKLLSFRGCSYGGSL
jgi:hypothetical protein